VKSELQANGTLAETRIYVGNYEKQTDNAGTKELHYVYGGNGLCAIIVRQNGSNNIYVTYSDHLGSVLTLTDLSGNVVAEQNFDAWGRKRNPQNWTYNSVPPVPAWLYRGYTGHEHLTQFALIDMNGRLYDPVQGRMISPDNYIPNPFGTQGYNRYAYGNNNPMSYVDPDGNFPVFIIIAAAVFAVGNTAAHAIRGDIDNFWDGLRYFGQGAITGAALATGIGAAMQVPVLGVVIKGAAMAYAASTALSVGSAVVQSIATGNIAPLANAGRIYLGNFYLDENKSFFGGVWEGISRFTWQLPQSTIGHASAALTSAAWQVRSVTYYGGATAVETNAAGWGGVTQGSFVIGARGLQADPNNPLFQHEYGHYIQSQLFGPLYYGKVGIPSLFSTGIHNNHPTEQDANIRAQSYFNRHAPGTIWDFVENPINNPDFRLGFHWFDPIDPFGIINTIVLNNQN
jgi:RHS repeat-associated protein